MNVTASNDRAILILGLTIPGLAVLGGGITPGALPAAALLLTAAWAWTAWRRPANEAPPVTRIAWIGTACLGMLFLTAIPLPAHWTFLHGSLRAGQNREVLLRLEQAARMGLPVLPVRRIAFTRNLAGTQRALMLCAAALAAAMLSARLRPPARQVLLRLLGLAGAAIAAAGLVSWFVRPQGDTLWWTIPIPPVLPGPVACFVNRNHFAGFLALLCVPLTSLGLHDLSTRQWRRVAMSSACLAILFAALLASQSRGALLALAAGLPVALGRRGPRRRTVAGVAALLAAAALGTAAFAHCAPPATRARWTGFMHHPPAVASIRSRTDAWRDTLRVWRRYPLAGAGANALRMTYPRHRRSTHRGERTHAENQYLQLAAETGLFGILMALALAAALHRALALPAPGTANPPPPLAAAARGALTVAAVHALVDFPHHVPLYAVVMAALIALGLPVAIPKHDPNRPPTPRIRPVAAPALALALVLLVLPAGKRMQRLDATEYLLAAPLPELSRALASAPTSWLAWYEFGRRAWETAPEGFAAELGENAIAHAAALNPNQYQVWLSLGYLRLHRGDREGARTAFTRVRELRDWVRIPDMDDLSLN